MLPMRRKYKESRRVEVEPGDVIVYKGKEIDAEVLASMLDTSKRLLWAFAVSDTDDIMAFAYTEAEVLWLQPDDILQPEDVEL